MSSFAEDIINYKVLGPGMGSFSTAELKLTVNTMSFNSASASELGYPEAITILSSPDGSKVFIRRFQDMRDFNLIPYPFYDQTVKPKRVCIRDKEAVQTLRTAMQWLDRDIRRVPGIRVGQDALLFDLRQAVVGKSRLPKKHLSLENYPSLADIDRTYKPLLGLPAA